MGGGRRCRRILVRLCCRGPGDVEFGTAGSARQHFDGGAIKIARCEIHAREERAACQDGVNEGHTLEQLRPIHPADRPQAGDDVADRGVRHGLLLQFVPHHGLDSRALRRQAAIEPGQRRVRLGVVAAQPVRELNRERVRQPFAIRRVLRQVCREVWGVCPSVLHPLREVVRCLPCRRIVQNQLGDAPQVFDQYDPKDDRYGP